MCSRRASIQWINAHLSDIHFCFGNFNFISSVFFFASDHICPSSCLFVHCGIKRCVNFAAVNDLLVGHLELFIERIASCASNNLILPAVKENHAGKFEAQEENWHRMTLFFIVVCCVVLLGYGLFTKSLIFPPLKSLWTRKKKIIMLCKNNQKYPRFAAVSITQFGVLSLIPVAGPALPALAWEWLQSHSASTQGINYSIPLKVLTTQQWPLIKHAYRATINGHIHVFLCNLFHSKPLVHEKLYAF